MIKAGRFGRFLACPGYPECSFTKPLVVEMPGKCPNCGSRILKRTSKNGYTYYACEKLKDCGFMTWDVPVKDNCPQCGKTLFKRAGRGFNKPFCVNTECPNFLPEDKRGYMKKTALDSNGEAPEADGKAMEKQAPEAAGKTAAAKAPAKKGESKKTEAKQNGRGGEVRGKEERRRKNEHGRHRDMSAASAVTVVGAGLAGCEAAWQLAESGIEVELVEMKPGKKTPAHVSDDFCEMVCSNSFRSDALTNAVGLLKEEMRRLGSLVIACADKTRIPAGGALAVDRAAFSRLVTDELRRHPRILVTSREQKTVPEGRVILATGPLTTDALAAEIGRLLRSDAFLSFYDAAAPIVTFESIDMDSAYLASRYGKGTADYINCPLMRSNIVRFERRWRKRRRPRCTALRDAGVFEGCMPIEVMARRGADTMRYGPLKPVGLTDPKTGKMPFAVVQLRKDNEAGTLYNMVGFQTHLKFGEQKRVFSMIPALRNAEFVRYGVMHRNTDQNSPLILDRVFRLRENPRIGFAGQITGVEGYVESAASGLLAGLETARELKGLSPADFPAETAIGALALYVSGGSVGDFQPMNVNFGIISPLLCRVRGKKNRNAELSRRSLELIEAIRAKGESL